MARKEFIFKRKDFAILSGYKKIVKKIETLNLNDFQKINQKLLNNYLLAVIYKFECICLFMAKLNNLLNELATKNKVNSDFRIEYYSAIDFLFFEITSCWDVLTKINNLIFELGHEEKKCNFNFIIRTVEKKNKKFIKSRVYYYLTYPERNPEDKFDILKFMNSFVIDRTFTTHYGMIEAESIPVRIKKGKTECLSYLPYTFPENPHHPFKTYPNEKNVRRLFDTAFGVTSFIFDETLKDVYTYLKKKLKTQK